MSAAEQQQVQQQPESKQDSTPAAPAAAAAADAKKDKKAEKKAKRKAEKKQNAEATSAAPAPVAAQAPASNQQVSAQKLQEMVKEMQLKDAAASSKGHKFWDTQPVPKLNTASAEEYGEIETKTLDQVQKEPYGLPKDFEWYEANVNDKNDLEKIFSLLEKNYVEDDDSMFRFAYPKEFLYWALTPPGYQRCWHVVVRVRETGAFMAFISGVPLKMQVAQKTIQMVEINFLCVHKQLRDKRLAPLLIKEVTRRVNLLNIWQAVYTAGVKIPKPITAARYYHRSLNPPKLISIGFSRIPKKFEGFQNPMKMVEKYYKLPDKPQIPGFREMKKGDSVHLYEQLTKYLSQFTAAPVFEKAEFTHWMGPVKGVVYSYVVEDPETKKIVAFGSFYSLPSTIIGNQNYKLLNAAYLYYYFTASPKVSQIALITDLLVQAKSLGFDVFNCLDIMDNAKFVHELKFGPGDGNLHYYLFNYKCPDLQPNQVGLTML